MFNSCTFQKNVGCERKRKDNNKFSQQKITIPSTKKNQN